jgi:hypothetical protein
MKFLPELKMDPFVQIKPDFAALENVKNGRIISKGINN